MIALALLAISFAVPTFADDPIDMTPGDAVGLESVAPAVLPVTVPSSPIKDRPFSGPWGYGGLAASAVIAGVSLAGWRHRRRRSAEPLYVLVHGYGGSAGDFDDLLAAIGADSSDTVAFDYRSVVDAKSSTDASRIADTEAAARKLDALIRRLSVFSSNIYSLHHSKGGAVGVSMIASLDDGTRRPIDGYRGAALLDPAIASGWLGSLQRAGGFATFLPDNGDFDPIRCSRDGCRDVRVNLGEESGVEVIAVRNPDAVVTNFTDDPEGLRVYDLVDDGKSSALLAPFGMYGFQKRVREAHRSVLTNWAVADCIKAEVANSGGCVWKGNSKGRIQTWGGDNGRNLWR
ncbi:MAG: hypothetical protein BMS9Abin17_1064 [Acidimicrobiia bacterium]|nr:MAG: hypothetical protein BMS9Abin17_1064 [Acidimicrobiia bacterium]